ncbi:MAG: leucine--tRNA ligase [Chitinophagales bacterium]|nr:leucine--tRNA ligase [Chitinophagales bacterium]
MSYNPKEIRNKWQTFWKESETYKVSNDLTKPKFYVLDMFPYPSGSGLHVGHPLGYVASDIYSRYKRLKGFNVLHPMGFDAFGLPAEQYAIETGKHPGVTTAENIATYKRQLNNIGLSFDWSREVITSDPSYYKWTQWIFTLMFNHCYCKAEDKAMPISDLLAQFEKDGNTKTSAFTDYNKKFSASEWKAFDASEKDQILMHYRLAYRKVSFVNWCEALGTVLANDEVVNGVSERGGHPVVQKPLMQWSLRITAYAERLLQGIKNLDWSESLKAQQENWIGRSEGATVFFEVAPIPNPSPSGEGNLGKWITANPGSYKRLEAYAKEMRQNPTTQEARLWEELRGEKLGDKFRRQHVLENYIPDFVCLEKKLIVEVDGEIHFYPENIQADLARAEVLEELGYKILRFKNEEVDKNISRVLLKISEELSKRESSIGTESSPSPEERGLGGEALKLEIFTTRPDTIFGVTFMVIAPEHALLNSLVSAEQEEAVKAYIEATKSRSNVDRQASKEVSGVFTGSYAIHPFTGKQIPIWIGEYVLIDYGTGAIMAVPSDDDRDYAFAKHFGIEIIDICDKSAYPNATKSDKLGKMINSDFLNGMEVKDAIALAIQKLVAQGIGNLKVNYKLRDANFSRQRYWGEPFPIAYDKEGAAIDLPLEELPLELPPMDDIKPVNGKAPLSKLTNWSYKGMPLDTDTMPGNAGSSWYFLRYMDPNNDQAFCSTEAVSYWQDVDLYIGGTEHAVGHLMYSRFWHKFLYDLGKVPTQEPFKKLINQGMIQGESAFEYKVVNENKFVSYNLKDAYNTIPIHVAITLVNDKGELDLEAVKRWRPEQAEAEFVLEDGKYIVGHEVEKMSKSKHNVVNPDDVIEEYGADCFRMFEMFLGPIENHKPWQTKGIDGVARFLRKFWNLAHNEEGAFILTNEEPTEKEMKIVHTCIKKVNEDIERFSFNTCVSAFMICVNDLSDLKCHKQAVMSELVKLISPFAPHIAEELWHKMGNTSSVVKDVTFPQFEEKYLVESVISYPVSINGKMRVKIDLAAGISQELAKEQVLANEIVQKWMEGNAPKKFIFVPGRIVNIVV